MKEHTFNGSGMRMSALWTSYYVCVPGLLTILQRCYLLTSWVWWVPTVFSTQTLCGSLQQSARRHWFLLESAVEVCSINCYLPRSADRQAWVGEGLKVGAGFCSSGDAVGTWWHIFGLEYSRRSQSKPATSLQCLFKQGWFAFCPSLSSRSCNDL